MDSGDGGVLGGTGEYGPGQRKTVELLLRAPDTRGSPLVLLQRRTPAGDGDRWGLPSDTPRGQETPTVSALRMAAEQAGVLTDQVRIRGAQQGRDRVVVVLADVREPSPGRADHDGPERAWVPEPEVAAHDLGAALAADWPMLRVTETGLLVDAANVVGSRPDGWWRDRAGAAQRLLREIAAVGLPGVLPVPEGGFRWFTRPVVVLEGKANSAPDVPGIEVVRAPAGGDDTVVDLTRRAGAWTVVTADRGLRARLPSRARAVGPTTLRSWLTATAAPQTG